MRTALIRISPTSAGFEARLVEDWDGASPPPDDAPAITFASVPEPPEGFDSISDFVVATEGASPHFATLGRELHDLLFGGELGEALEQLKNDEGCRMLLEVVPEDLRPLPWELMRSEGTLTFTDVRHPVARLAPSYEKDADMANGCWPLRVLLVVGSHDEKIAVADEVEGIHDAFRTVSGLVDLEELHLPTRKQVRDKCRDMKPHVLHFMGHGNTDSQLGGYLRLDQEDGASTPWTSEGIHDDLMTGRPRVAILNACYSGTPGAHAGTWAAVQGLARLKIPAIVAMQGPIRGRAAERFAAGLYGALATGDDIDVAVAAGRVGVTEVAQANQREYALPVLILGAPPEHILSAGDLPSRLTVPPVRHARQFVDRVPKRRRLWDRMRSEDVPGPSIFAVTGPANAGKGALVRWCLGIATIWDHPVAHVTFEEGETIDSVAFVEALLDQFPPALTQSIADELGALRTHLAEFRANQARAEREGRYYEQSPTELYQELASALVTATAPAERQLVIGIDGLTGVDPGQWLACAVPGLVKPIARGLAGDVRLVVSLQPGERESRFPARQFEEGDIEDVTLDLFPRQEYPCLARRFLRARDYVPTSFEESLREMYERDIRGPWNTVSFEVLLLRAKQGGWQTEGEE
jgi:hypothetical protein